MKTDTQITALRSRPIQPTVIPRPLTDKPICLDLFCCAGGAGKGYADAGFFVIGIDKVFQPNYPFNFIQADVLMIEIPDWVDFVHASPPCQVHSSLAHLARKTHKDLIPQTRDLLKKTGKPYVIENVVGAPLINPIMLCGSMFGLQTKSGAQLQRHRIFETNVDMFNLLPPCSHSKRTIGIFGNKARDTAEEKRHYKKPKATRGAPPKTILFSLDDAREAMGIDWMSFKELSQAIPPAYTEYFGKAIIKELD